VPTSLDILKNQIKKQIFKNKSTIDFELTY